MSDSTQANEHVMRTQLSNQYELLVRDMGVLRQVEDVAEQDTAPDELLKQFVGLIGGGGLAEHCSIMLLADGGAYLELRAVASRYAIKGYTVASGEWGGKRFALGEGVAGRVASTGVHVRFADATAAAEFLPLPDSTIHVRSLMCFPLQHDGEILGVLNLSHGEPETFDIDRENAMALIARRMGRILGDRLCAAGARQTTGEPTRTPPVACGVLLRRDHAGRVLQIGEGCAQLTGLPPAVWAAESRDWSAYVSEADRPGYRAYLQSALEGEPHAGFTYYFTSPDGELRRLHETTMAAPGAAGELVSWVQDAVVHEVLSRCFSSSGASSLLHAQRVHMMGALANGVIHDLNNLLTGVVGNLDLALGTRSEDRVGDLVSKARTASIRGADIVNKVLKFGRAGKASAEHSTLEVSLLLDEAATILQCSVNPKIQIEVAPPDGRIQTCGDERQLVQALVNLGVNARDALEHRKADGDSAACYIRLGAEHVCLDETTSAQWGGAIRGNFVRFFVVDNGDGMSSDVVARIFEPFFSARSGRMHTGLGLPTVKRIVEAHQGWLDVQSTPGRGTTVNFYVPALSAESKRRGTETEQVSDRAVGKSGACVLLVDDESLVRNLGIAILGRLGYRTLSASGGQEALNVYRAHAAEIDVVLLDLHMPDMGGEAVLRELRTITPGLPIIYSTGIAESDTLQWPEDSRPTAFLNKPYLIERMAEVVREALASGAGHAGG